jgi:hypothetical protein
VGFHRAPGHLKTAGYLSIIAAFQKQFNDLTLAWAEPNMIFPHASSPSPR